MMRGLALATPLAREEVAARFACPLAWIYGRKSIVRVRTVPGFFAVDFKIAMPRAL